MRLKPNAGFIEVDVPLDIDDSFEKRRGVKWGEALRKAKEDGQNAFGATAGFEKLPGPAAGSVRGRNGIVVDEEREVDSMLENFDDANQKGHVLNKQTLGGQVLKHEAGQPMYMVGAFRGSKLLSNNYVLRAC
jgi:DNA-directed RNA polymerase III subunit RPC5